VLAVALAWCVLSPEQVVVSARVRERCAKSGVVGAVRVESRASNGYTYAIFEMRNPNKQQATSKQHTRILRGIYQYNIGCYVQGETCDGKGTATLK